MAKRKTGIVMGLLLAAALLSGCEGALPLAQRGMVQGIFAETAADGYRVLLLYEDAETDSEFDTAIGQGETAAQAFGRARQAVPKDAYFGQTDLLILLGEDSYESAMEWQRLILNEVQPMPSVQVWAAEENSELWEAARKKSEKQEQQDAESEESVGELTAAEWYQAALRRTKELSLQSGFEKMAAGKDSMVVPLLLPDGCGVKILRAGKQTLRWDEGTESQLALFLAGKCKRMALSDEDALFRAAVNVPIQQGNRVTLRLNGQEWLSYHGKSQEELQRQREDMFRLGFEELLRRTEYPKYDVFGLSLLCEEKTENPPMLAVEWG